MHPMKIQRTRRIQGMGFIFLFMGAEVITISFPPPGFLVLIPTIYSSNI